VERSHGVYQDRLVKELRIAQISTIEDAHRYLMKVYLPKINEKVTPTVNCGHGRLMLIFL